MITHETKLWPDLDSQQRIFICVEGVAPQVCGCKGKKAEGYLLFIIL